MSPKAPPCRHPGLVRCLEAFEDDDCYYQVLEHCPGGDLYAALQARGDTFSEAEVAGQVCPAPSRCPRLISLTRPHSTAPAMHSFVGLPECYFALKLLLLLLLHPAVSLASFLRQPHRLASTNLLELPSAPAWPQHCAGCMPLLPGCDALHLANWLLCVSNRSCCGPCR